MGTLLSRLVVKCVRSTTSLAVTMDLALGQVILLLVVSSLVGANSETFRVSSTGDAATIQGSKMGDYVPTSYAAIQGHPVYEKTNGRRNFLYVSPNGFWTVGSVRGSGVSGIYNPHKLPTPSSPPTTGWRYLDGTEWKDDATLTVEKKSASSVGTQRTAAGTAGTTAGTQGTTAGTAAVDQTLLGHVIRILARDALTAVSPRTAAEPSSTSTAAPADSCPDRIQVRILFNGNTDIDQAALNFDVYGGTYIRQQGQLAGRRVVYSSAATIDVENPADPDNPTPTDTILTIARAPGGGPQWQMRSTAAAAFPNFGTGPHLINDSGSDCPPRDGWRFQTGVQPNTYSPTSDVT